MSPPEIYYNMEVRKNTCYNLFVDLEGREAVGESETFSRKRTLEAGQAVQISFKKIEDTQTRRAMQKFANSRMNMMTTAMFGKNVPDPRPRYTK